MAAVGQIGLESALNMSIICPALNMSYIFECAVFFPVTMITLLLEIKEQSNLNKNLASEHSFSGISVKHISKYPNLKCIFFEKKFLFYIFN